MIPQTILDYLHLVPLAGKQPAFGATTIEQLKGLAFLADPARKYAAPVRETAVKLLAMLGLEFRA